MKIRNIFLALLTVLTVSRADILVNLDATGLPTTPLTNWTNTGTLGGTFNSSGGSNPTPTNISTGIGTVRAVPLNGVLQFFVSSVSTPASMTGSSNPRTIEAWVHNPSLKAEETIISWGRRGTVLMNHSFNYGSSATLGGFNFDGGAAGGSADMGWNTAPTNNTWHYLVYTYDGTFARLYVDGYENNVKALTPNTAATSTGAVALPFVVGTQIDANGNRNGAAAYTGQFNLGRIRVRNEVLSAASIESNYFSEGPTFGRGNPTINSFTASTTVVLPGQPVTLAWNILGATSVSINNGVGTVATGAGNIVVQPTANTTYTITATNAVGTATANAVITLQTPTALRNRWSFNEPSGTTFADSVSAQTGNLIGTGATLNGTQVTLPGGSSASAAYVDLPNGLLSSLNECTIEGWTTINGAQNWSRVFDFGTTSAGEITAVGGTFSGTEYMMLSAQIAGSQATKRLAMRDNNVEQNADLADVTTNGQQFHFALVYRVDGGSGTPTLTYYKNGVAVGTLSTSYRLQNITDNNNWLGRSNFSPDLNTQGSYNEFRIWNGALSATAVADSTAAGPNVLPQFPRIDAFNVYPSAVVYRGDTAKLSYLLADPASLGITATIDQGVGSVATPSGAVNITPTANTTYTLTVTNSAGSRTANVAVTVLPSEPTALAGSVSAGYQTATPLTLFATDPNTAVGSLTYTIVSGPTNGSLSGTGANRTYTPNNGFTGTDTFTFKANDGLSDSNVATVTITVLPPPSDPTDIISSEPAIYTSVGINHFVTRLRPVDPNPTDTFTLALIAGAGDTHNGFFTINGSQLIATHDFSGDLGQTISIRVRVTDNTGRTFEKIFAFPVELSPELHVKINEINYNPARNTQLSEFIELYNPTNSAVDLSNWRFDKGITYTFPGGTSIPANGYLVVAADPFTINAIYGVTALGPWTGGLDSDGEEIVLRDALGVKVDGVDYGITAPWPVTPNGDGPSLELVHPTFDNDMGGNWRASTQAPTSVTYLAAAATGWSYRKGTSEASSPTNLWHNESFTLDGTWLTGQTPIGIYKKNNDTALATNTETGVTLNTQLTDMATYVGGATNSGANFNVSYGSVYFRKTFTVAGSIPKQLLLRVQHNDAAIVWINGVEVARFGFPPGSTGDVAFNSTAYYERGNDPWSELVIANANTLLHTGVNTIAIHGFAKAPYTRAAQEDLGNYNIYDFSVDAELKNVPELIATPGAQNSVFTTVNPPAIREIKHLPKAPLSSEAVTISAKISDPQGVASATLSYQIVTPGNFIPSTLPLTNAQILANPLQSLPANPAFELPANWTTINMVDDGSIIGDTPADGIYTAIIPAQPHRTLVRYRISATDLASNTGRVPSTTDPRKNFAYYTYNGVPTYVSGAQVFTNAQLTTLPVYHWLTRASDYSTLLAYNGSEQFANTPELSALLARRFENFEGALVVGDQVIDHALVRLRGGNSRYNGAGKRHFRFVFPNGTPLEAADEKGNKYPRRWKDMLFNKLFGNKGYYDFGLPYEVGGKMWSLSGVPIPESHWVHFRVVRDSNESNATLGDFWGLYQALELPDGPDFLAARDLERGNFYKMSDWMQNGEMATRSQAPGAVDFAEDFDNIRYNIHQGTAEATFNQYVNVPLYYKYNAVKEAIRHYDIFTEPTGRHRVKNLIYYFQPIAGNPLGKLWLMPYDWDASFGPNWNSGWDVVHNAIYNHDAFPDSPTWTGTIQDRTAMRIEDRNAIRELRDLLFYRDSGSGRGPVDDIIDDAVAKLTPFYLADLARWPAPGAPANYPGGAPAKAADMKAFLFSGWTDTAGNGDPAVGAGGRAAYLDSISDTVDAGQLPTTPTITDTSSGTHPVNGITLQSSAFADPQGAGTFAAMQWRVGEITDPTAPTYDPTDDRIYEMTEVWGSGEIATFSASISVPSAALKVGHTYRARVRHKDTTGRWSHWSAPATFTTTASNYLQVLRDNLVVTEVMYRPLGVSGPEGAAGYTEGSFEYIEMQNISAALTLDLTDVRINRGVDFSFAGSAVTSLAPGARVLVVKNTGAFTMRHGAGKPVAGAWASNDSLNNGGEEVQVVLGAGNTNNDIKKFTYLTVAPWPTTPSTTTQAGGYSLVLINPAVNPDHSVGTNWRASNVAGGSPGGKDTVSLADWMASHGQSDPSADPDNDGYTNAQTFAFATDVRTFSLNPARTVVGPDTQLDFTYTRRQFAENVTWIHEYTTDFVSWNDNPASFTTLNIVPNGDGTETVTVRVVNPVTSADKAFIRVHALIP